MALQASTAKAVEKIHKALVHCTAAPLIEILAPSHLGNRGAGGRTQRSGLVGLQRFLLRIEENDIPCLEPRGQP
jgi:hypothetical protein